MLKRHADIIQSRLSLLVDNTNLNELVPKLISNHVFTQDMIERILAAQEDDNPKLQAISIFSNVNKRGPQAFSGLMQALNDSHHQELATMLQRADEIDCVNRNVHDARDSQPSTSYPLASTKPFILPEYIVDRNQSNGFVPGHFSPNDVVNLSGVDGYKFIKVKHSNSLEDENVLPECYKMDSKPRGFALIVNNIQFQYESGYERRNGAENDDRALQSMLEQLYFTVEPHRNKTRQQMMDLVEMFAGKPEWQDVDCCVVALMSHGREGDSEEDTEIMGVDGLGFKTRKILSYFHNDNCPRLIRKPKIFIFQACRGDLPDRGVELDLIHLPPGSLLRTETDGRARARMYTERQRSDIFIAHPVPPGIMANRDKYTGSWFIQKIVEVFSEYAWKLDLENLLKIVDVEIKKFRAPMDSHQTVTTVSIGWSKRLFFNPGLHKSVTGETISANHLHAPEGSAGMDVVDRPARNEEDTKTNNQTEKEDSEQLIGCLPCRPS